MFCVQSVALEVYGVMLCVLVSPRKAKRERRRRRERIKRKVTLVVVILAVRLLMKH